MTGRITLLAATLLLGGCIISDSDDNASTAGDAAAGTQPDQPAAPPPPPPPPSLELEVDVAARELRVYRGGQVVATHPVAVGSSEWPTPTGEWTIGQVILNPRWIPPEESWAEDEEEKAPGDPENPLGAAQLVYAAPNSIHGTNAPESLGRAVSHGSIRVANEVAVELARMVMEAGGAPRDAAWFEAAQRNRTERQEVIIPNPVPIRVVSTAGRSPADSAAQPQ
jgi:hypothetical protein